jgi:hypothetical protein
MESFLHEVDMSPAIVKKSEFCDKWGNLLNPTWDPYAGQRANKSELDILKGSRVEYNSIQTTTIPGETTRR